MEVSATEIKESYEVWLDGLNEELLRVRHYAHKRFRYYEQRLDLDELVEKAFRDVYNGRRHPPLDRDFTEGMCVIVGSKVSNWRKKERRHQSLDDTPEALYSKDTTDSVLTRCYVRELVEGDPTLMRMVELLEQDPGLKPRHLAEMMKIPIEEIYNARDRLMRRISKERGH